MKKAIKTARAPIKQSALTAVARDIVGAGGGGKSGGGRGMVEAKDSLRSRQFAQVIDVVSEGPIYGVVGGLKGIYYNETPVLNQDGSANFFNMRADWRTGEQAQAPVAGFNGVEAETSVNVLVRNDTPITRTVTNPEADMLRVTVAVAGLTKQDTKTGDINGTRVDYEIWLQNNGGGFKPVVIAAFDGKTSSRYQRAHLIELPGDGPWDVRVHRMTADSTASNISDKLYWDSFTTIVSDQMTYPNTAYVATRIDSSQFNAIPGRAYRIKGMIVQVPSNYNPDTRAYVGAWDGNFKPAWTDNPAWCFYDMVTNERYGLGDHVRPDMVDKWQLYSIAQYCDELVPDGKGGMEPRFTCNLYLQSREEALQVLQNMASIFRAIAFWAGGTIVTSQDRVKTAVANFTNANVEEGRFAYSSSSVRSRSTAVLVTWNDPDDMYRQKIEAVQDDDAIKRYGYIQKEVVAFGCTSRGQARRYGKWLLLTERYESETVSFVTGMEGVTVYPGAIIETSDYHRARSRFGGRLAAATATTLTLDADLVLSAGHTHWISVIRPSDGMPVKVAIQNAAGTHRVITVPNLGFTPDVNSVWLSGGSDLEPQKWRVMGGRESENGKIEITALQFNPSKFDAADRDSPIDVPPVAPGKGVPDAPADLAFVASRYAINGTLVGIKGTLSWSGTSPVYVVRYRRANGAWETRRVVQPQIELDNLAIDIYSFEVTARSALDKPSQTSVLTVNVNPGPIQLPDLTGLVLDGAFTTNALKFKWNQVPGATAYEVRLTAVATGLVAKLANIGDSLHYTWTAAEMKLAGGPWRNVKIEVRALGQLGAESPWATISATNPQVGVMGSIQVDGGIKTIMVQATKPDDGDFAGMIVWAGTTPGFVVNDSSKVYDGADTFVTISKVSGSPLQSGTYYVRVAGYDDFGKDSLTISASMAATVFGVAPDANSITEQMIKDGVLTNAKFAQDITPVGMVNALPSPTGYTGPEVVLNTADGKIYRLVSGAWKRDVDGADIAPGTVDGAKFAQGIEPVGVVPSLPSTTGYTGPKVVFNQADGKTYRLVSGAWKKDVDAADIAGTIAASQIAAGAVDSTKFASSIEPITKVTSVPSTKSTNTIFNTTDGKLYRWNGAAYVASVPTADLTGTIAAAQIAPGAIDSTKLASGLEGVSIVSSLPSSAGYTGPKTVFNSADGKLYRYFASGWVASVPTADLTGTISAAQIAANAVTAGKIAADAVTAGTIAAGAISAREVAAGAITASKLVLTDTSNIAPDADMQDNSAWVKSGTGSAGISVVPSPAGMPGINCSYQSGSLTNASSWVLNDHTGPYFPMEPDTEYRFAGTVMTSADATGVYRWELLEYDGNKANTRVDTLYSGNLPMTSPTRKSTVFKTLPDTKYGRIRIRRGTAAAGTPGDGSFWASMPSLVRAANGELIVDGSVTTDKLVVGNFTNHIPNGDLETGDLRNWRVYAGDCSVVPSSTAGVPAGAPTPNVLRLNGVATGTSSIFTHAKAYGDAGADKDGIAVVPGEQYLFKWFIARTADANATTARVVAYYRKKDGTYTTNTTLISYAGGAAGISTAWTEQSAAWTVPADATRAYLYFYMTGTFNTGSVFVTRVRATRISDTTLIADGAITTGKIVAGAVTANELAANAVTAGKIATDAVTAGTIAAGAISAREIAAGAITAGKLVVADTTNLVPDADLQDTATTWPSSPFAVVASPSDMPGINSFYTDVTATTPANSNLVFQGWCQFIPIEPNTEYRVTGWVKSDADATGTLGFYFHQFGADKLTDLGASAGGGSGPTMPAAAPRQLSYTLKTGPNARFLRVRVRRGTVANGGTCAGQVWASLPSIVRRANAEMLVDGAITTAKLAAGAVTTNELAAGAVSADKLQANAVTAGKIAAGAVSADQIAAGALSIGKFGAERWSLQKAFGVDGSDVSGWQRISGSGVASSVVDATAMTGGAVMRVAGFAVMEWKDNIPFDPNKLYKITAKVRRTAEPTTGGKGFYVSMNGIAANGTTRVNTVGANSTSSQHYIGAANAVPANLNEWVEYVGYFKGWAAVGASGTGGQRANASDPGVMHASVRFFRPTVWFNYNNGDGTADLDSLQVDVVEIPANSVGVTHIQDGAISTDKLQANSITASKLVLSDTTNLVPDADMQDANSWSNGSGHFSIVASPSDMPGINSLYQSGAKTAAAGNNFISDSWSEYIPVEPDTEYRLAGTIKTSADATGTWRYEFCELDAAKAITRYNTPGSGVIPQASPYRSTLTVKTLTNTKYLRVRVRRGAVTNGGSVTGDLWASMPSVVRAASAELIVDGAVTAGKIAADAVTAGTVAAGAINARELAAGAVTTDKLVVGNFDNQIPNGDFASGDLTNWRPYSGTQSVILGADASVPAGAPTKYVMRLASAAAGRSAIFSHAKAYQDAGANMDGIRVTAGQQYDVRFKIVRTADATVGTTAVVRFYYLRKDGTTASGTIIANFAGGVTGIPTAWTEQSATFTVPATTPEVDRVFLFFDMNTGFTAGSVFVADVRVTRVSDATLIADGAITTQKLVAAAVTADKVAANAITADKLVANAVTADKLAASAVTAAKIAAGAVTADHLSVGQSANMLVNPGFESDWYGWSTGLDAGNGTFGMNTSPGWYVTGTSNKTASLYENGGAGAAGNNGYFLQDKPCEPGKTYMGTIYSGAHRCDVYILLEFRNASGTYLAAVNPWYDNWNQQAASGGTQLATFKRLRYRATAPAGAASVRFICIKTRTKAGFADSWLFALRPYLGEVGPNQTEPPAWDAAGATMIGPGNISTSTLSAITANLGDITAGTLSIADATRDNYVRSGSKWWADGQQGWILARQAGGGSFLDMYMGNSRIRMSSWGDCAITFPNFSIDNAGNLYCRGDIQANSLTANVVNTPHLMYRSVSDMAYAYYLYGREAQGRLYFTLNYDSIVLLCSGPSAGATMRVVNANTGGVIAGGMNGQFVGFAMAPGYYFYGPEGDSSNAYYVTVIVLKR